MSQTEVKGSSPSSADMLTDEELDNLIKDLESDRVERKESLADRERIRQAICAFANDLPGHGSPGVIFIGATDRGDPTRLEITDELLRTLADMRSDGNILPIPSLIVRHVRLRGSSVAVVEVQPSDTPPVRLRGQVWIRIGPRRAIATLEEERRLTERQVAGVRTFDRRPCLGATLDDLLVEQFRSDYLRKVVDPEVLAANRRGIEEQLASLRFFDLRAGAPTHGAVLLFGTDPLDFMPGAYVQFVRFDGATLADAIQDEKQIAGNLFTQLLQLDNLIPLQIRAARVPGAGLEHQERAEYPRIAVREIVLNAVMHRVYEGTNAPVRINWFNDRVEIQNPGGLFGQVTPDNYERVSDYRNPILAEAMKVLGYVERFGTGITRANTALRANGNPPAEFTFEATHVLVTIRNRP